MHGALFACIPCNKKSSGCVPSLWPSYGFILFPVVHSSPQDSPYYALESGKAQGLEVWTGHLIYRELGGHWCQRWDSAISQQWRWTVACENERVYSSRKGPGPGEVAKVVTCFQPVSLRPICWPPMCSVWELGVRASISRLSFGYLLPHTSNSTVT